jgi:hypothetical protein
MPDCAEHATGTQIPLRNHWTKWRSGIVFFPLASTLDCIANFVARGMVMNGLYALIAVISLILSAICLIALLIGRSRHRAAKLLAGSVLVFITAVIMFQPEVKSTEQVQQGSEGSTPGAGAGAKTSDGAAEPTITAAAATNEPGMARICLTGDDVKLPPGSAIAIPATTVLEDQGPLKGTPNDPSTWGTRSGVTSMPR